MQHDHAHDHKHHPMTYNNAFFISIWANGIFALMQIVFALFAHSTSLLADAVHNVGDVLSLILAWGTLKLGQKKPTVKATYGMKKTSILAALTNGILLVFSCGVIVTEAMYKFFSTVHVEAYSVMIVAFIGILVNGGTALLFLGGQKDLNIRGAFLHLAYDALISLGVVISAGLMILTDWMWIDPVVGLLIAFIILRGTWALFTDSFRLIIDAVPRGISLEAVRAFLLTIPGVSEMHDLHIWALSTHENALSVHLVMPDLNLSDTARHEAVKVLQTQYDIHHVTIQVEKTLEHCHDECVY